MEFSSWEESVFIETSFLTDKTPVMAEDFGRLTTSEAASFSVDAVLILELQNSVFFKAFLMKALVFSVIQSSILESSADKRYLSPFGQNNNIDISILHDKESSF